MKNDPALEALAGELADGRTDLVFELLAAGCPATWKDERGVSLVRHCAWYGDVSAIKFLLTRGESLDSLGDNFDLNGASFHGHWRLCKFLLEKGANVNQALVDTGETPLHAALCKTDRVVYDRVLKVLLSYGANPNQATKQGAETGSFMRDCRTKGKLLCTARPLSATPIPLNCCSKQGRNSTPETCMAIPRSHGPVGTRGQSQFFASFATASSQSTRSIRICGPACSAIPDPV